MPSGKVDDVIIVGGGIVGMAVAHDAARRGLRVRVLDRDRPGSGATWAAAGLLSPLCESSEPGHFLASGLASLRQYPAWIRELREVSGVDPWFRADGKVRVARHPAARSGLEALETRAAEFGLHARRLGTAELAEQLGLGPGIGLAPEVGRSGDALLLVEDGQVDNRRLHRALIVACRVAGVAVLPDAPVHAVDTDGDRVVGVRVDGVRIPAGAVVVAAGAWGRRLQGIPFPLPVRPVRGQMLALEARRALPRRVLESEEIYLVPRTDGRLLVGATVEDVGFRSGCTPEARDWLLEAASALVPALRQAPVLDHWSGLRPGTPDHLPILGGVSGVRDLYLATGHYRNGLLLAPWTASAVGRLLAGGGPGPEIPIEFQPLRFQARAAESMYPDPSPLPFTE